jgi:hypothetical protein
MPRIPRGQQAGFFYHLINRGNGCSLSFQKAQDYFGLRLFQTFQWFDGLTMSGSILNRCAPFIPGISPFQQFQPFQAFQRFTHEGTDPFHTFQSFNRFALFKTFQATVSSKVPVVPIVPAVPRLTEVR